MSGEPRVLIVENNDAIRAMLLAILRHQPVGVDSVSTAEEALRRVSECDYALILVDLDMPDDSADRFLSTFRERRPEATTFVLAVQDPKSARQLDPGIVSAVMNKPVEIDRIADVVRECALVIPPPEDPLPCPPAESEVKFRPGSDSYLAN